MMTPKNNGGPSTQLCWTCQKACGGCSWSSKLKPVPGWTAEYVEAVTYHGSEQVRSEGYNIFSCPEYVQDEPREVTKY